MQKMAKKLNDFVKMYIKYYMSLVSRGNPLKTCTDYLKMLLLKMELKREEAR